jgi:hypothetical protein
MWNTPDSAQFTVNLIITWPYFHEKWAGQPFPKNPGSGTPFLSQRIGHLIPEKQDFWWEVTPKSDIDRIASDVTRALSEVGLPFLDRHADLQVLTEAAARKEARRGTVLSPELSLAILLVFQGKPADAARLVRELAAKNKLEGFADTIRLIARRLELKTAV